LIAGTRRDRTANHDGAVKDAVAMGLEDVVDEVDKALEAGSLTEGASVLMQTITTED